MPIHLPPLRERRDDIPALARHFVAKLGPKTNPQITKLDDGVLACLMAHNWPGNVRELENVVEQALVFASGDSLSLDSLPEFLRKDGETLSVPAKAMSLPEILDDLEHQLIVKAFRQANGVKNRNGPHSRNQNQRAVLQA